MTDTASSKPGIDLGIAGCTDAVEIGRGGFGVVYRALQSEFHRTVAVKVIGSGGLDDAARMRFQREVAAMGSVSGHPNIVTVHQAGFTADGSAYIVMAFESRGSLGDRLRVGGPVPWPEAVSIGVRVAGALEAAHRAGVLHRDVKPENILLSAYGEPKLADFGIARVEGSAHTRSGLITASIAHAAPEILAGMPPSVASDVYALASTVYALVLGRPAFALPTDESFIPVLTRIAMEPVPDLRPHGVADDVCRVLERATAKDPAHRHPSAEAFGADLQRAQQAAGVPMTVMVAGIDAGEPEVEADATAAPAAGAAQRAASYHAAVTWAPPAAATAPPASTSEQPTMIVTGESAPTVGRPAQSGDAAGFVAQPTVAVEHAGTAQAARYPYGEGQPTISAYGPMAQTAGGPALSPAASMAVPMPAASTSRAWSWSEDRLLLGAILSAAAAAVVLLSRDARVLLPPESTFELKYRLWGGYGNFLHLTPVAYVLLAGLCGAAAAAVAAMGRGTRSTLVAATALAVAGTVLACIGLAVNNYIFSRAFFIAPAMLAGGAALLAVRRARMQP